MVETLLQVSNLSFGWPGQPKLFQQLDLQLQRGEVLAGLAPTGVAKAP